MSPPTRIRTSEPTTPDPLNLAPVLAFAHATKPKQGSSTAWAPRLRVTR